MDHIVHVHSDIHASCDVCQQFLSLDMDQKISHYERKHGYVVLSGSAQSLPGPYAKPRHTRTATLGHPVS